MSAVRLSDIIEPQVFFDYISKETTTKTALFQSNIVQPDPMLAAKVAGGGRTFNVPGWNDLDDTESDVGNDDPTDDAVPGNLTTFKDIARRQFRTRGWSTMNLSKELAGADPVTAIGAKIGRYWTRQFQKILVATLRGVFDNNVSSNASDMVVTIGTDAVGAASAAELISAEAVLDARQTLGDNYEAVAGIMMHSVIFTRLNKQNLIDFIPDAEGKINFGRYLGYPVIVDDGCPAIVGTNRTKYWTFLMGPGSVSFGESPPDKPVETISRPSAGRGTGDETIWTRRQFAMHPMGIKFTDTVCAGEFPTNTELQNSTNWSRVYAERKQIPMALLVTNG